MSDPGPPVGSQLSGEKADASSFPDTPEVTASSEAQNAGSLDDVTDESGCCDECSAHRGTRETADVSSSAWVLTEEGLKEVLYTSFSSESREFESIINLYLNKIKSTSEQISLASSEPCNFKNSGLYSELKLENFVRLSPSTIGYPSASWNNIPDNDKRFIIDENDGAQTKETQMKLKLWITRETHPTPDDLRTDIVLKMIVVEEVNKKGLMGPFRAYLTPEGVVEFHTASPDQKEGSDEFLRRLFENVESPTDPNGLDLETVVSAVMGTVISEEKPREMGQEGASSSNERHNEPCNNDESLPNAPRNDPETADEGIEAISSSSDVTPHPDGSEVGTAGNALITDSDDPTADDALQGFIGGVMDPGKPSWHRGVGLNEIFTETYSDDSSDTEDGDRNLPTAADLKMLQLLRSSSSENDVSEGSAYTDEDIDAGLRELTLEPGSCNCDGYTKYDSERGELLVQCENSPETSYAAPPIENNLNPSDELLACEEAYTYDEIRSTESPIQQFQAANSLRDLGLQVIDPMGLDVISQLTSVPYIEMSLGKAMKKRRKKKGKPFPEMTPKITQVSKKISSTQNEHATPSRMCVSENDDLLESLQITANKVLPVEIEPEVRPKKAKGKAPDPSPKMLPEKTVPPILGKIPEPAPHGFARHLGSAGPSHTIFGPHPAGHPHPALGAPLIQGNYWTPLMVSASDVEGLLPPQPQRFTNFQLEVFSKWPDEFGRFVAHSLSLMAIEHRMRVVETITHILNQDPSTPAQGVPVNMVRPPIRPPFPQMLNPANQTVRPPLTFNPQNWPPLIPPAPAPKYQVIGNPTVSQQFTISDLQYCSHMGELYGSISGHKSSNGCSSNELKSTHSSQAAPLNPSKAESTKKSKTKAPPSKLDGGKSAKKYLERAKLLRAAKKAARKAAQAEIKSKKTKTFCIYPSSKNASQNAAGGSKNPAQSAPQGGNTAKDSGKPQPGQNQKKPPQPKDKAKNQPSQSSNAPAPKPGSSKPKRPDKPGLVPDKPGLVPDKPGLVPDKPGSVPAQTSTQTVPNPKKTERSQKPAKKKQSKHPK